MNVLEQTMPQPMPIPGIAHATWAGRDDGVTQISVWRQSIAPGSATPPHHHDCDEVVLCLAGNGTLEVGGKVQAFGPRTTLVLPRGQSHQIINTGAETIELLGVFGSSPVATYGPDGAALALPWRT